MITNHTPGPWDFQPGTDPHQQAQIYGEDGKTIAITYNDENSATAGLIAAAPELLQALQSLIARVTRDAETYAPDGNEPVWAELMEAHEIVMKAIR